MAVFTDDFTGPDGQLLEARSGWTKDGGTGTAEIASNRLAGVGTTGNNAGWFAPDNGSADHYVEAEIWDASHTDFPLVVRMQDRNNFACAVRVNAGNSVVVARRSGGTITTIDTISVTHVNGNVYKLEADGSTARVYQGATLLNSYTISTFSTETKCGLVVRDATDSPLLDNWKSDALAAPAAFSLSGAVVAGGVAISGAGAHVPPGFALSGAIAAGGVAIAGAAAHTPPNHALSGAVVAGGVAIAGTAAHVPPGFAASGAVVAGGVAIAGTAAHTGPPSGATLSGAVVAGGASIAGTAAHTRPTFTASGAVVAGGAAIGGAAAHTRPDHALSGPVVGGGVAIAGTASHAPPVATGPVLSGAIVAGSVTIAGTAAFTPPAAGPVLSGGIVGGGVTIAGVAHFVPSDRQPLTVARFRAAAVEALKVHVPLVAGRVHSGRVWPVAARGPANRPHMPALLVDTARTRRRTISDGGSSPAFRVTVTLTVIARSERRTAEAVEAELDALHEQIALALLHVPGGVREMPEEWEDWETLREVDGQTEQCVGQDVHAFDCRFTEFFEPVDLPRLTGARLVLDAAEPFDRLGDHGPIAPFRPPAPPPRSSGPDGRAEAETTITYP